MSAAVRLVVAAAVAMAAPAADSDAAQGPEAFGAPTADQVARSIRVWDPVGSVHQWEATGTVRGLEQITTEAQETVVSLDTEILFDFGKAHLPSSAAARIAELLADVPDGARVSVVGHTDNSGDPAFNQDLSERRANAVAEVVADTRDDLALQVAGRGESEPVEPNDDAAGREANRRVEIRYAG